MILVSIKLPVVIPWFRASRRGIVATMPAGCGKRAPLPVVFMRSATNAWRKSDSERYLDPGHLRPSLFGIARLGERGYRVVRTGEVKCLSRDWDTRHRYQVPGRTGGRLELRLAEVCRTSADRV